MGPRYQKARPRLANEGNLIEAFPFAIASKTRRTLITTLIQDYVGSPSQHGNKRQRIGKEENELSLLADDIPSYTKHPEEFSDKYSIKESLTRLLVINPIQKINQLYSNI